jgi:hypothetical protein
MNGGVGGHLVKPVFSDRRESGVAKRKPLRCLQSSNYFQGESLTSSFCKGATSHSTAVVGMTNISGSKLIQVKEAASYDSFTCDFAAGLEPSSCSFLEPASAIYRQMVFN